MFIGYATPCKRVKWWLFAAARQCPRQCPHGPRGSTRSAIPAKCLSGSPPRLFVDMDDDVPMPEFVNEMHYDFQPTAAGATVVDVEICARNNRALTLTDAYTRECLAIWVDQGIRGEHVVTLVDALSAERGAPRRIQVDNGPGFVSKVLDRWAYERHVELAFSRPGKPTDNAFIEAFNGRLRQECLNQHWFLSLADARSKIEAWRTSYNESRPHGALGWAAPAEFARRWLQADATTCLENPENSASEQF